MDDRLEQFKKVFHEEMSSFQSLDEMKEYYARELAKRDMLIEKLQEQNKILLQSSFRRTNEQLPR